METKFIIINGNITILETGNIYLTSPPRKFFACFLRDLYGFPMGAESYS